MRDSVDQVLYEEGANGPGDDLTGHFVSWICKVARQAEVSDFELAVGCDEQVIRFEIL
jgi:hypothetical protein